MNAQEVINQAVDKDEDNMRMFYPNLWKQKKADENLTKCLRDLN